MPILKRRPSTMPARRCFRRWTRFTGSPATASPGAICCASSRNAAPSAELSETICNHTFRGTGITVFLQNGGSLEAAQDMANHSDPRTTKLYDRRKDLGTLSEIERRIAFE